MYDTSTAVYTEVGPATQGGGALAFPLQAVAQCAKAHPPWRLLGWEKPSSRSQYCFARLCLMGLRGLRGRCYSVLWRLLAIFPLFGDRTALFGIARARASGH